MPWRKPPIFGLRGLTGVFALAFGLVGWLVATRRSSNPIGWLLLGSGLTSGFQLFAGEYATYSYVHDHGSLPLTGFLGWVQGFAWIIAIALVLVLLPLLFPDGHLPSPRWRFMLFLLPVGVVGFSVALATKPGQLQSVPMGINNPYAISARASGALVGAAALLYWISAVCALVAVVGRFRRSIGEEREQIKWIVSAVGLAGASLVVNLVVDIAQGSDHGSVLAKITGTLVLLAVTAIPVMAAIAIVTRRLYDIDVVINKTLVYGALAAFITAVYVGIVVGIGAAIGQGTSKPNLGLSILATAVVAVAFQPVRERIQRFANRLVYGKRATPYEVLSEFGHRMAQSYAADDVLPRMARILGEGTGAKEARVWLSVSGELHPAAAWPDTGGDGHARRSDTNLSVPVLHQGEELGALSITKAPGERLSPAEEKLTTDLASQAGLVLRNVKLIEDLKASRVRLVQAQDYERRRIERNIHDGAQQQLVALNVQLGLAKGLTSDAKKLDEVLAQLQEDTNQALADLRDLARGIYPPLLQDKGLAVALEAQARRSPLPVAVRADGIGRYPQDVEAAVYFCTLEALQNVAKYAGASQATVTITETAGSLTFEVTDDGVGFDTASTSYGTGLQGMADRLAALGGDLELTSSSGELIRGRVPVTRLDA